MSLINKKGCIDEKNVLSLIFMFLFIQNNWASHPTLYEKEPNNTPAETTYSSQQKLIGSTVIRAGGVYKVW